MQLSARCVGSDDPNGSIRRARLRQRGLVRDAGEDTAILVAPDIDLLEASDDESVNLVVTDLDPREARLATVATLAASVVNGG